MSTSLHQLFTDIADAIWSRSQYRVQMRPEEFPYWIEARIGTSELDQITTVASDVRSGKKFIDSHNVLQTGTMADNAAQDISLAVNGTYTIPAGYHTGNGRVKNTTTEKAAATYYAGASDQTIAANQYLSGVQTIKALTASNLTAANVKKGVTVAVNNGNANVFEVTGSYEAETANYRLVEETFTTSSEHYASHLFGAYSSFPETVVGVTLPSYKITLDSDARFLMWEAYLLQTDANANKRQFTIGFVKDFSRNAAQGSGQGFGTAGITEVQTESFCERPDANTINKKIIYVPAEPVAGAANTYKVTFVVAW